jgi:Holliday junction resolvase RusA-like endonuclease
MDSRWTRHKRGQRKICKIPVVKISIKGISVNQAYRGRRFATPELKAFKETLGYLLPRSLRTPIGNMEISFIFGVSSKASDLDNLLKATIDTIAERYMFNDKKIYKITAEKVDVPRGKEYIAFEIAPKK